uniref:C2H2-type domain-containing protein n=1 Tax=Anopheles christyi TaxID=43041 RepID=A0A182KBJ5_9DIPT
MMLKKQALLQQMNLMSEYCHDQNMLPSGLKAIHDIQLQLNAQRLQQPPPPPQHQPPAYVNNQQLIQELHQQQQLALRYQQLQHFQQSMFPSLPETPATPLPPTAVTRQPAPRPKVCVKQAPMLNFVRHNGSSNSSSSSSISTHSSSKDNTGSTKRPTPVVPSLVEQKAQNEKQQRQQQVEAVTHPVPTRPVQMTETGPLGDVAPATVLRSLPTPVQTATIQAAVEHPPQHKKPPSIEQQTQSALPEQQPTVLLTQLKQEPMVEEQEREEENNSVPKEAIAPVVAPPSIPSPVPPTTTPPFIETKPTIFPEANTMEAIPTATIAAAAAAATIDAVERSVSSVVASMAASNTITTTNQLDQSVTAVNDAVAAPSVVAEVVANGADVASAAATRERQKSKDDEIHQTMTNGDGDAVGGTQQLLLDEKTERKTTVCSPLLPVHVAATAAPQQQHPVQPPPPVVVKRGRGRPPKSSYQKSPPSVPTPTPEIASTREKDPTPNDCLRANGNRSNEPCRTEAQPSDLKTTTKKKGYISVATLFGSAKALRKEYQQQQQQQSPRKPEPTVHEVAIAAPETTVVAPINELASNVVEAANAAELVAENKTEHIVTSPLVADATNGENDTVEVNGLSNLREEIKVQPVLPEEEAKQGREGSVASGDSGESSVSSLSTEEGASAAVAEVVAKESTILVDTVVADTEKESSPASDSGIESVNESGTTVSVPKRPRGRPKSIVSFAGALIKEDKQSDQAHQHQQIKEEKEQKPRLARRKSLQTSVVSKKDVEEEETSLTPDRAGKRAVRTTRKPSVKAKEAAESAEVEQSADGAAVANETGTTKCTKCEMCFKTELWYKKHLINFHDIDPVEVDRLLAGSSSSCSSGGKSENNTFTPVVPEAAAHEPPDPLTNGEESSNVIDQETSTIVGMVEAVVAESTSLLNGLDEVAQKTTVSSVEEVPSNKLGQTSPSSLRKRKTISYDEEQHPLSEAPPSIDSLPNSSSSNSEPPAKKLVLPTATTVKVEHRTSGAHNREQDAEDSETLRNAIVNSPLPVDTETAAQLAKDRESSITPSIGETTKVEKPDPDDADKLTPFEAAKVNVIESEMTGETHYTCTICGGQFTGKANIKEHLDTVHATIKKRSCEYCGRTFMQTGDLTRHVRIHTGHRPFKCPVPECSFACISSGDLHKHVRRHNQEPIPKPHVCDQCGKDFERSYDLKRHKTMHAKSEPDFKGITCGVCGKVFARRDQYRAHTYRHIGYRPYQCDICGKSFTDPSNFSKHARLHEMDGIEAVCNFCGRKFKNKCAISKHIFHCQRKMGDGRKGGGGGGVSSSNRRQDESSSKKKGKGKEGGGGAMIVKPKQENATDLLEQHTTESVAAVNGGRTKKQLQASARKRKRRRARTPSSTEEDDDEEEDLEEEDDSGDDFVGPSSSELYGSSGLGVTVKRERRSRKSGGGHGVTAATEA